MRKLKLILILSLFIPQVYGQSGWTAFGGFYKKVTIYDFNPQTNKYKELKEINVTGAVSFDKSTIFLAGYKNQPDQTFKIISKTFNQKVQDYVYKCSLNCEAHVLVLSKGQRFLSQYALNHKFIVYQLETNDNNQKQEVHHIKINKNTNTDNPVYIYSGVDKKPLFQTAKNKKETTEQINKYILNKAKELKWDKKGDAFVSIVINKQGKVTNPKIIYGNNKAFNDFALKITKAMPTWSPGEKNGKKVRVSYNFEVKIE